MEQLLHFFFFYWPCSKIKNHSSNRSYRGMWYKKPVFYTDTKMYSCSFLCKMATLFWVHVARCPKKRFFPGLRENFWQQLYGYPLSQIELYGIFFAVLWIRIRFYLETHLYGSPGSGSVLVIRIRIQEHVNWAKFTNKPGFLPFKKAFVTDFK